MNKRDAFLRYVFIIKILRNYGRVTFDQINDYLLDHFRILDNPMEISQRTLQRDLKEIQTLFGIEIKCNHWHQYFIANEAYSDFNNRMLEAFDVFNSLSLGSPLSPYMLTEPNCKVGTEHLLGILHAIRNNYVIRFLYQKYYEDAATARSVSPLGLKESEGRWYLVARDSKKVIKVFGLDRISELEITTTSFAYPLEFDLAQYFQHSYGATRPDHLQPQDIVLSFKPLQGKYIKTFPLHQSQKILIDNSKELQICIRVYITLDLIMKLWSYGTMLTVVSPPDLLQMEI